ncbi:type II toxin-antitoxin system VapC family toxin [Nocardioides hungaricus]
MRYLLDTNVVSELRRRPGNAGVNTWVREQSSADLAISVITVLEIETGILRIARTDRAQADRLTAWFEQKVLDGFAGRILPVDLPTVRRTASLHVPDPAAHADALIAATALARDLVVVTRNVPDFVRTGVDVVNPWS